MLLLFLMFLLVCIGVPFAFNYYSSFKVARTLFFTILTVAVFIEPYDPAWRLPGTDFGSDAGECSKGG